MELTVSVSFIVTEFDKETVKDPVDSETTTWLAVPDIAVISFEPTMELETFFQNNFPSA